MDRTPEQVAKYDQAQARAKELIQTTDQFILIATTGPEDEDQMVPTEAIISCERAFFEQAVSQLSKQLLLGLIGNLMQELQGELEEPEGDE